LDDEEKGKKIKKAVERCLPSKHFKIFKEYDLKNQQPILIDFRIPNVFLQNYKKIDL
jgi:hypothetical protein